MAAPASTKAGLFSGFGQREEDYALAFRSPRRTGGVAVDTGGAHGKDKSSIVCVISCQHCLPIIFFMHSFFSISFRQKPDLMLIWLRYVATCMNIPNLHLKRCVPLVL